jgi:hypothetical protein
VLADLDQLVGIERPALAEDLLADRELADVVQRAADPDGLFDGVTSLERADERQREIGDASRVGGQSRVRLGERDI